MTADVRTEVRGRLGRVTLARPKALNALSLPMIRRIDEVFSAWETDDAVDVVLIDADGERGFCAGGDVKTVHEATTDGSHRVAEELWREQHLLDALIATYTKPVVCWLHGLVLGGGVGLGCHASHRLVTPSASVGMPEVGIGLSPDVGGLFVLGGAPDRLGFHLALTGHPTGPLGAVEAGLADRVVAEEGREELARALADGVDVDDAIAKVALSDPAATVGSEPLLEAREWIAAAYAADSLEGVLERLDARPEPEAAQAAARLRAVSPIAVQVTWRALQQVVGGMTLPETFVQDLRRNVHFSHDPDLREGLRAAVIDKDRNPRWTVRLDEVMDEVVAAHLGPFDGPDLEVETVLERAARTAGGSRG